MGERPLLSLRQWLRAVEMTQREKVKEREDSSRLSQGYVEAVHVMRSNGKEFIHVGTWRWFKFSSSLAYHTQRSTNLDTVNYSDRQWEAFSESIINFFFLNNKSHWRLTRCVLLCHRSNNSCVSPRAMRSWGDGGGGGKLPVLFLLPKTTSDERVF